MKQVLPRVQLYGYMSGEDLLSFHGESGVIEVSGYIQETLKVLQHCTGHSTADEIVEAIKEDVAPGLVRKIIRRLTRVGIVADSSCLYEAFHINSANPKVYPHKVSRQMLTYLEREQGVQLHKQVQPVELVRAKTPFLDLVAKRKSCRYFSRLSMSEQQISGMLEALAGRSGIRSVPSGGGLYPISVVVALLKNADEIEKGIYEYDLRKGALGRVGISLDVAELQAALADTQLTTNASAIFFVVADMSRATRKYANRGYRHVLIESGHMAQNAYLFSAEQGVGVVEYGGFTDEAIASFLHLSYPKQTVLTVLVAGIPGGMEEEIPESVLLEQLQKTVLHPKGPVKKIAVGSLNRGRYRFPLIAASARYVVPAKKGEKSWTGHAFSTAPTSEHALLKVLGEAWERYVPDSMHYASWTTAKASHMQPNEWLNPYDIYPVSREQQSLFSGELSVFDPETSWQWVWARRHSGKCAVHVPVDAVYYQQGIQRRLSRMPCIWASSNGVAAHPRRETAIQSATLELIERDALMTTWYGKRNVKALPVEYVNQVVGNRLKRWIMLGFAVKALDITTDTVPAVLVLIHSKSQQPAFSTGSAAAETYELALAKAFAEAELMALSWSRRTAHNLTPEMVRTVDDHGLLYIDAKNLTHVEWLLEARYLDSLPQPPMSVKAALDHIDPFLVDMTPRAPKTGLHVIRAVSPKLLPINFGFATEPCGHPRLAVLGLNLERPFPALPHFVA